MTIAKPKSRIASIDLLRGIVMVVMALDHCRDMIHYGALIDQDPLDLKTTTPVLFVTRWITHFCAPIFVLLSGTSIFLYGSKGRSRKQISIFLLTRGLFLMLLEILLIQPLWAFGFNLIFLQVIWAIGLAMVCMSILQFLPFRLLCVIGLAIIAGHNLLDKILIQSPKFISILWALVHQEDHFQLGSNFYLDVHYPFLPWLGIMIMGYCLGKLYLPNIDPAYRKTTLRTIGWAAVFLFIILRWINIYGDPNPWAKQNNALLTLLDFINVWKYPPSLLYILMTIGPGLIFLSYAEKINNLAANVFVVFGKVPLFYYIIHVPLIHLISWAIFFISGHKWNELDFIHMRDANMPFGGGSPLWVVYLAWMLAIFILYFPCRWYGKYKATHSNWWLSYI